LLHIPRITFYALRLRQPKGGGCFLLCGGGSNDNISKFKSARGAKLHALRVTVTEITVLGNPFIRREPHYTEGTRQETHLAANTAIVDNFDLPICLTLDRYRWTYRRARRIGAMHTHHRLIELFLVEIRHPNA
jgi:hypothetical protein